MKPGFLTSNFPVNFLIECITDYIQPNGTQNFRFGEYGESKSLNYSHSG
jgi:hypothetical protein